MEDGDGERTKRLAGNDSSGYGRKMDEWRRGGLRRRSDGVGGDLVDHLRACSKTVLVSWASTCALQGLPSSTSNLLKKIALIMLPHYASMERLLQGMEG